MLEAKECGKEFQVVGVTHSVGLITGEFIQKRGVAGECIITPSSAHVGIIGTVTPLAASCYDQSRIFWHDEHHPSHARM